MNRDTDHDLALLDRATELNRQAEDALRQADECHRQCEGQAEVGRLALADAEAAAKAHDQWLAKGQQHRERAEALLAESAALQATVRARCEAREESP